MEYYYVYQITNIINGRKYIGKRKCHCEINKDRYMGSGIAIKKAIKKYGRNNFTKEILAVCDSEAKAYELERIIIEKNQCYNKDEYYNIAHGGLGNTKDFKPSKEMIEKILETKRKNGTMPIGSKNGMFGKYNYEQKCVQIVSISREGITNVYPSEAEAERVCGYKQKTLNSKVVDNNRSHILNGLYWLKLDDYNSIDNKKEFIERIKSEIMLNIEKSTNSSSPIYQINITNGEIIKEYKNVSQAAKEHSIDCGRIYRNLKHQSSNCARKGLSFIYKSEYESLSKNEIIGMYSYHNVMKGIPHIQQRKKVICITTGEKFDSIAEAENKYHIHGCVGKVCKKERKYAGKHPITSEPLVWEYIT